MYKRKKTGSFVFHPVGYHPTKQTNMVHSIIELVLVHSSNDSGRSKTECADYDDEEELNDTE